ncbi:MAG: Obg family GTPase CgtA, partial [Candidatus Alkaliphilus sp. MAG34]
IGFPNVGKSTLLSVVTSARPKIANYHFTTLTPNLGIVQTKHGDSFVLADIPGLIEGAHEGAGLGHEFLRHTERTKLLIHVLDISGTEGRDPLEDFEKINTELRLYNEELAKKPQVVAANKIDIPGWQVNFEKIKSALKKQKVEVFSISAVTGQGLDELLNYVSKRLKELEASHKETVVKKEKVYKYEEPEDKYYFTVYKKDDVYIVEGKFIERLINSTNFDEIDSLGYFQKVLENRGVIDRLKELGMSEGDTVRIYGVEFEHFE